MAIYPISTSRVSDLMVRSRLTQQSQSDQLALFRVQNQISTGRRIFLPSEDTNSALRALSLQRTIERKDQIQTNVSGANLSLTTAEGTLQTVANAISDVKSAALGAVGTVFTEANREETLNAIDESISALLRVGNTTFNGSYLFAGGKTTVTPYERVGDTIQYNGNEERVQTYADIGFLFETSIPGDELFGGLSDAVRGRADLNPQVTTGTKLSQLNGGQGISPNGAIEITFSPADITEPTTSAVIDLSAARSIGDIATIIERDAPAGAEIVVQAAGDGLGITVSNGTVLVKEVAGGSTAEELGIATDGASVASIDGEDLDPSLLKTDELSNLVGTKAQGRLELIGSDNDLIVRATENGAAFNNLTIVIQGGGTAGSETVAYDDVANELTLTIEDGETTSAQIAEAINNHGVFEASPDPRDLSEGSPLGLGFVSVGGGPYTNVTDASGAGVTPDLDSGLLLTNGEEEYVINTSGAETVEDVLNLLNRPEYGFLAEINEAGTGIDVRSRRSGANFSVGENGGTTAADLGIRSLNADTELDSLNRGVGLRHWLSQYEANASGSEVFPATGEDFPSLTASDLNAVPAGWTTAADVSLPITPTAGDDLRLTAGDGTTFDVDFTGVANLQEALDAVNNHADNDLGGGAPAITARVDSTGLRLELVDNSGGADDLSVERLNTSLVGQQLGFYAAGDDSASASGALGTSFDLVEEGGLIFEGDPLLTLTAAADVALTLTPEVGDDLQILAGDGVTTFDVDFTGVTTLQGALDAINNHAGNDLGAGDPAVTARIDSTGRRIELIDNSGGLNDLTVTQLNASAVGEELGFYETPDTSAAASGSLGTSVDLVAAGSAVLTSSPDIEVTTADGTTFQVDLTGVTTAQEFLDAVNNAPGNDAGAGALYVTAQLDPTGQSLAVFDNTAGVGNLTLTSLDNSRAAEAFGFIAEGDTSVDDAGSGSLVSSTDLETTELVTLSDSPDLAITTADGTVTQVNLAGAETVDDIVAAFNDQAGGLFTARVSETTNSIELVDNTTGPGALAVAQVGTSLAGETLGFLDAGETSVADISGQGVLASSHGFDLEVVAGDGTTFQVDLSRANTMQDVLDAFNSQAGGAVTARLAAVGNGVELVDNTGGPGDLTINQVGSSFAGEDLGFFADGETTASSSTGSLTSEDPNPQEVDSVFTTLIRLREAILAGDEEAIGTEINRLDEDADRLNFGRAEVGSRLRTLETIDYRLADEEVELRAALSQEIDVDFTEAVSDFTARQFALQASLQMTGQILQQTLLNYI
ncbi:flagellar hook-associated protein FlgL [Pseudobythopirellula maris]|uniref:Flagellin n=1 Tax=Pseudobythopirellula maris TaxID=2527991 RepID=A0A5C5ZLX8_9BACT|nr:flagellin [Pseudobythopirellula maris]TWT88218.1 flagellar hook-associated protein FlgL [Pseudobythopirellula maris]